MEIKKSVFISRQLEEDSVLWNLQSMGYEVLNQSLIELEPVPLEEIPETDWIFFYSKNAFIFFLRQAEALNFNLTGKKIAAIGQSSAEYIKQMGYPVAFIGSGHGDTTVDEFARIAGSASVLFPRAKNSLNSVARDLPASVDIRELVVYDNKERENMEIPAVDMALLTSPMNARVFFKNYKESQHPTVISIGRSTAEVVREYSNAPIIIADQPSEESMMDAILENLR